MSREGSPEISEIVLAPAGSSSFLADDLGVFRWTLSGMAPVAEEFSPSISMKPSRRVSALKSFTAYSDNCPQVACDLIAEYVTDTILRIDGDATVDVRVLMKLDLIIVSGEVGCSHPAKHAIIHSDQFLQTLNGSIRDLLNSMGIKSPPVQLAATTVVPPAPSPMRPSTKTPGGPSPKPPPIEAPSLEEQTNTSNNNSSSMLYPEDEIDPVTCHVIMAITPAFSLIDSPHYTRSHPTCTVRARATNDPLEREARTIANLLQKNISNHIRGVAVEVTWKPTDDSGKIAAINVSFCSPKMNMLIADLANSVLNTQAITALSTAVCDDTVVTLKCVNRLRCTAVSSPHVGKDWSHPLRFGPVLARLEAINLVDAKLCSACNVELTFHDNQFDKSLPLTVGNVTVYGTGGADVDARKLEQIVREQCQSRTLQSVIKDISLGQDTDFFTLNNGGSRCALEYIEGQMMTARSNDE